MKNEMLELADLVTDVSTTMERDFSELRKAQKAQETWSREIEEKLSKAIRGGHGVLSPASGPGDHMKEAAGNWFAGCILRKPELRERGEMALGVQKAGLDESNDSEGGYLVPQPLAAEVLRLAAAVAAVRPLSRVLPMTSKTLDLPDLQTEPSVSIVAEEATIPVSEPVFGQKMMSARKIASRASVSLEVSQDSIVSLGAFLLQLFAEKIASIEDLQALEGNGASGNFMGLFSVPGVGAVSVAGALTNVDPFITALRETLPLTAQANATWVMHPKLWGRITKLKSTTNEYLVNPTPTADVPMSLLGRPVRLTDQISVVRGSGNDTSCYVGDFARGMIFGDRMRMELGINPFVDWGTAQISVRVIERVGILVGIPRAFVKLTGILVS